MNCIYWTSGSRRAYGDELTRSSCLSRDSRNSRNASATGLLSRYAAHVQHQHEKYEEAGELINRALQIDPDNAIVVQPGPRIGKSITLVRVSPILRRHLLWRKKACPQRDTASIPMLRRWGIYAHICSFLDKDFNSALHYFDRALRLNPNLAFVWALSALTYCYIGDADTALQRLERHRDLTRSSPTHPCSTTLTPSPTQSRVTTTKQSLSAAASPKRADFVNGYKPLIAALGRVRAP